MKYLLLTISVMFFSNLTQACNFIDKDTVVNSKNLMGKKQEDLI